MASVLSAIQAQLITDIETTSIEKCYAGDASGKSTVALFAEIYIGGGNESYDMTSVIDRSMTVALSVQGQSQEQVELALEELMKLWRSAAKLAVLRALGVLHIFCTNDYPPVVFAGSITQKPFMAGIEYTMTVRYTA